MQHAWHFRFAVSFGVYGAMQKHLNCVLHPLAKRYVFWILR
ncbi:TPA: DUF3265 domain-containing protein [Vibrio parahaemolyticus]|nr:DUF3265 domain-containing protein [Vibrio parahaemolyticus]HCH1613880.1 DUF3265 domain-containing protein [Vibrio parahaemolyticus]